LQSGLRATIQTIATTRFMGLAVRTILEVPPKTRGRPTRKPRGEKGHLES
jgi:hypothetical protein